MDGDADPIVPCTEVLCSKGGISINGCRKTEGWEKDRRKL